MTDELETEQGRGAPAEHQIQSELEGHYYGDRLRLRFVGELEQRYRRYCGRRDRRYVSNLLNILIALYVLYGACDWFLLQDQVRSVWLIRYGFALPGLVALWLIMRFHRSYQHLEKIAVAGLLWLSITTLVMARVVPVPVMNPYLTSVLAIIMAGLTITRLRFWHSVFTGVVYLLAVVLVLLPAQENARYLLYYLLLSAGVVLFCCVGQYSADRSSRREFLQKIIIHRKNLQLRKLNLYLRDLAEVDALTGIANRRYFDAVLDEEWRRARRRRYSVALLMCDIDFFKAYNDKLGHVQGDVCIRQVAQAISQLVRRPGDLAARYGGEEFAVILPALDAAEARLLAQNLCDAVRDLGIPHPGSAVQPVVTISVGVAALAPIDGNDPKQLITQADEALYCAKHEGRNRVSVHLSKA
ncbi:MAG TPA: diguanylate cyclase [Dongiaceae bacterium]|nr:diguanylate cyclase [Dongiaceae bacterium]